MISRIAQDFFGEQIPEPKNPEPEIQDAYSEILPEPAIPSPERERGVIDDKVSRHPDSCPDCATQPNCHARRDCLELVKAGYRAERIGMRFEAETPENLGKPIFWYKGTPLAWENDTAETKVYAWCLTNLFPGRPLSVDIEPVARLLGISPREVKDALSRLVKGGNLIRSWEKGRELYKLVINY